ncbi:hypothetical protein C8A05DRAFT_38717 [Staphylotrichum tortipilum]|uniref:Uncharacterized protein n=1 Tax=Staphylotrichum tortipilum TaxID=2831512 RepID=A0AAN6MD10_9PEZI|nr:hypothetical protein C8A05DRAFT_38717 [Staphylotrichum longicolle]
MAEKTLGIRESLRDDMKPFRLITEREMCDKDKRFIGWMKFDPRDRPSAEVILQHDW